MGWIISQALYEKWHCSQEQEEEYSEDTFLDGKQSAPLNGSHTQPVCLSPDKMTAFSRLSRFGMMCKPLTADRGEDLLTWYREDFLAKTYPALERGQASTVNDQECGATWRGLLARYDPNTHLLKTAQCSLFEDLTESYATLPRWGTMRNGALYLRPIAEPPINGTEYGLSAPMYPTPRAQEPGKTSEGYGDCLNDVAFGRKKWANHTWATPTTMDKLPPKSEAALHREATVARPGRSKPANLRDQVSNMRNWPTPRSCSAMAAAITPESSWNQDRFPNLETMVGRRTWPTPQASDNRDRGNLGSGAIQRRKEKGKQIGLSQSVSDISGALNPLWVEWLMGWPLGWTDLKPLAMDKFQSWQQQHSISCETDNA